MMIVNQCKTAEVTDKIQPIYQATSFCYVSCKPTWATVLLKSTASENEVGNVLSKTGKCDLPSSQGELQELACLCCVSVAHTDPWLPCLVYQCDHHQEQLQPTAERANILPTLSIITIHFAPSTWSVAQYPEAFQVFQSFSDKSAQRPEKPAQKILQVWASNWCPCCATEGLQGWVSPKVSVSISFFPAVTSA